MDGNLAMANALEPGPDYHPELQQVKLLCIHITMEVMGMPLRLRIQRDCLYPLTGRVFLQVVYDAPCTKTGNMQEWHGRKWYLSEHMTEDEVIKTAYAAFKAAVEHEVMEGFKICGTVLFNPHVDYKALLAVSHQEVKREQK